MTTEEKKKFNRKEYNTLYYKTNKEKERERNKKKYNEDIEKSRKWHRDYSKTPSGYKKICKQNWKKRGLNMKHFEIIFILYIWTTNCDICKCILTNGKPMKSTTKCLDHSHKTGKFRNIICHSCNVKRKEDNF